MTAVDDRRTASAAEPTGSFPAANLLPESVVQGRRMHRARRRVLMAIGLVAVLMCGVWVMGSLEVSSAEERLGEVQDTGLRLKAEQARYSEVPLVAAQVTNAQADVERALGGQVNWSGLLTQLALTAPSGAQVTRVTAALPPEAANAAEAKAQAAAKEQGVVLPAGQMVVGIRTSGFPAVSAWLDALAKQPTLANPTLTRSAVEGEKKAVTAEANVTVTAKALTNRYVVAGEDK